jgi:hypothetical protein
MSTFLFPPEARIAAEIVEDLQAALAQVAKRSCWEASDIDGQTERRERGDERVKSPPT